MDRVDDAHDWRETEARMATLGITDEQRAEAMQAIAAVLAIGNLSFAAADGAGAEAALVPTDRAWLEGIAGLLAVDANMLSAKLTSRQVSSGRGSSYRVNLTAGQCDEGRNALAQGLYVAAFEWIVETLNVFQRRGIDPDKKKEPGDDERFVGLLDIFGFENFKVNSFEQLCINFTNERLQAHFMDALVKLRVLEYEREGVPVTDIDFPDNEAQIELIDGKKQGIFAALDDECSVPKGLDAGFVEKLYSVFAKGASHATPVFDKLKRAKGGLSGEQTGIEFKSLGADLDPLSFVVVHYAEVSSFTHGLKRRASAALCSKELPAYHMLRALATAR